MTDHTDAAELVAQAAGDVLTPEATDRLRHAIETHNDGRVRRHLRKAAAARTQSRQTDGAVQEALTATWARYLHAALDEAWPTDHPAYRRRNL
jgi:hypothetical protein